MATSKKNGSAPVAKMVKIDTIHPHPRNPRKHEDAGVRKIAKSIERFDWQQPIVVNDEGAIIVGEGRYRAALLLERTEVPVVVFTGTKSQQYALMVADNKTGESSAWADETLAQLLSSLDEADLEATAFTDAELEKLFSTGDAGAAKGRGVTNEEGDAPTEQLGELTYRIIVNCDGEEHQAELIEAFAAMGLADIEVQVL